MSSQYATETQAIRPALSGILSGLKIGHRLGLGFAAVLALSGLMFLMSINYIAGFGRTSDEFIKIDYVKADAAATINTFVRANARRTMELFFAKDAVETEKLHGSIIQNKKYITDALTTLEKLVASNEGKQLLARVKSTRVAYVQSFEKVDKLLQSGHREDAIAMLRAETLPALDSLQDSVLELTNLQKRRVEQTGLAVEADVASARNGIFALGLGALMVGCLVAWWLTRSITRPLAQAVKVAETVAAGDLTSDICVESRDETGQLLSALQRMNLSLAKIVGQVRESSESIATGSAEIAKGNIDLSQRTEEQASNLQQTAASMEQLTATVQQNTQTARQATELAGSASAVASEGGRVVEKFVATMKEISTSSRRIADITSVIDGIAFQTNILALNAAVESARAGEYGRGFAVVAGEVRSLAHRASDAAKEIKTLINQSVERVESGMRQADEAGLSMTSIVNQVKKVTDLISEISSASIEQASGICQVGDAVNQLDQVTQQNAALVEESAAAAESLKHQAAHLAGAVLIFKVNDTR